jgi:predicted nucleic acid binding AN1-type Zn finger protein
MTDNEQTWAEKYARDKSRSPNSTSFYRCPYCRKTVSADDRAVASCCGKVGHCLEYTLCVVCEGIGEKCDNCDGVGIVEVRR